MAFTPINQTAKILIRRGLQIELPGSPTTLAPLVFSPGLDIGELSFSTDTGRLFIGHDPSQNQNNFQRTSFPYQNVEVLTENSNDTLKNIFNANFKEITGGFYSATLLNNADFIQVLYDKADGTSVPYSLETNTTQATVHYYLLDAYSNMPLSNGILQFMSIENSNICYCENTFSNSNNISYVDFSLVKTTQSGNTFYSFQYKNLYGSALKLFFNVVTPVYSVSDLYISDSGQNTVIQQIPGPTGPMGPTGPSNGPTGPTGPQGPTGAPGGSVTIKGEVNNPTQLPISGNANSDGIISLDTGNLYVWIGSSWLNVGQIKGPTGPQGPTGPVPNIWNRHSINDVDYNIITTDTWVGVTAITAPRTITLPPANMIPPDWHILIADESGNCSAANIIHIIAQGSDTIKGTTTISISNAYGFVNLRSNGINYWVNY